MARTPPGLLKRGVKTGVAKGKPMGLAVVMSARGAARDGSVSVVDAGDTLATATVSAALGVPVRSPVNDDLIVCVLAGPASGLASVADRLADQRRSGGDVLVAVVGDAVARRDHVEALRAEPDLGVGVAVPLPDLGEESLERLRDAVVKRLGPTAVSVARGSAPLRDTATRGLVERGAVRAGIVAALSGSKAASPVLSALQARMAADVSNLAGDQPQGVQAAQAAGVALSAPVWRQVARSLSASVPGWRPAIRAGIAYGVTRLVGLVATRLRRSPNHSDASEEER